MLTSLALIFLIGMCLGWIFRRLKLPSLLGMLLTGILLGPHVLNLLDGTILGISADLRQLALIVILLRAGLSLDLQDLKRVGRPALLLCFLPATMEILAFFLFGPALLHVSRLEAGLLGAVMGAVSPAVTVPAMARLMDEGWGTDKGIPQMIIAGASADDVYVIVLFTALLSLAGGESAAADFLKIPSSILLGVLLGVGAAPGPHAAVSGLSHARLGEGADSSQSRTSCSVALEHALSRARGRIRASGCDGYGRHPLQPLSGARQAAERQILQAVGGRRAGAVRAGGRVGGRALRGGDGRSPSHDAACWPRLLASSEPGYVCAKRPSPPRSACSVCWRRSLRPRFRRRSAAFPWPWASPAGS